MKFTYALFFLLLGTSCQFFETERVSSEQIYKEEIQEIDWGDIDTFPAFSECESLTVKEEQQTCFQQVLIQKFEERMKAMNISTRYTLNDTLEITVEVSRTGTLSLSEIQVDSAVLKKFPEIKEFLRDGIQNFSNPAPAYKRGIPVRSKFKLPLILNTQEL
jgi:hypothetical protein